ncbi:MFS general substrate transporter [Phanerochaete sordida]|uniref:MFS general substrate transporter n=1 Tax=Phanerochaete sordida TaxID=48140 RepID=A0A9P3GH39_9APHY|nr:MFS general substrate transporter [Phanerochaete sordida]
MLAPPKAANELALSPAQTLVDGKIPQRYSVARRYFLLIIFCLAQFLDAFNNSSLFSAIPSLVVSLDMTTGDSTWLISAFQLTFASFLLISGRISDVYNPKYAFAVGAVLLGCISIGAGFVRDKITLIVLRALSGIAASLTIPSALTLLVEVFPDPNEQSRAIGVFGGCGAIGNVLGLIIGAIFVQFASWPWVFWFVAILAIPIGGLCMWLAPTPHRGIDEPQSQRWKQLDLGGVSILTAALILFIFAITSGSTVGWASAEVLAPLVISVFGVAGFFIYETRIPASTAAVPPATWFLKNFSVLFGMALLPFLWWTTIFTIITALWQEVYKWSVISVALRMIPIGVLAFAASFSGPISNRISPKYVLLFAQALVVVATVLLATADAPDKYFSHVLPAFILGSGGAMLWYTHTNIAIFRTSPASMAGTVGAIFNGALQLGSAVGIAAVSSIESSVEARSGDPAGYAGRAAAFWFLLAIVGIEVVALLVFYRTEPEHRAEPADVEKAKAGAQPAAEEQKLDVPSTEPAAADGKIFSEKVEDVREEARLSEQHVLAYDEKSLQDEIREEPVKQV